MAYAAPGNLADLDAAGLAAWSDEVSSLFDSQIQFAKEEVQPPSATAWLYNPITHGGGQTAEADISWTAFPKRIADESPSVVQAWQRADNNRDNQEEYCEWEVVRDPAQGNKVIRVTVTCETADYFGFLAQTAPDVLLALYRKHVSPSVQLDELRTPNGAYLPQNRWNYPQTIGAHGVLMHMAQVNNTLGAAVNLVAVATWPRVDGDGRVISGEQALIACRPFGDSRRHSDPHIGAQVNALVRAGNEVAFADPAGLYMDSIDTSDWETPDGGPATDWFRIVRGTAEFMLRVVFEAPAGSGFVLGDVKVGARKIQFGGQITEKIRVRVRGIARQAPNPAPSLPCGDHPIGALEGVVAAAESPPAFAATRTTGRLSLLSSE